MKIIIKQLSEKAAEENDWQQIYRIDVDGKEELFVHDGGEPEDNLLGRDLNFVYGIPDLMKRAYDAGKNGEELIVESVYLEDKEEIWE